MLKLKYLVENFKLARMALVFYPHDEDTLEERMQRFRISANAVYPYECDGKLCFLRMNPATEKSSPLIREELRFIQLLLDKGYPALKPILSLEGEYFRNLFTPWGVWCICAFEGVPGVPLEQVELTEEIITLYGEALGHMHHISMQIMIPPDRPNYLELMKWIRNVLEDAPYPLYRECQEIRDALKEIPCHPFSVGMIHGDFELDNVFWDGEKCHVIDFDDCFVHFYSLDLLIALKELPPEAAEAFLRGYRAACPESRASEKDFPLMRRFLDLFQYARIMYALSERPETEPDWMPGLVEKLEGRMADLEKDIMAGREQRRKEKRRRITGI